MAMTEKAARQKKVTGSAETVPCWKWAKLGLGSRPHRCSRGAKAPRRDPGREAELGASAQMMPTPACTNASVRSRQSVGCKTAHLFIAAVGKLASHPGIICSNRRDATAVVGRPEDQTPERPPDSLANLEHLVFVDRVKKVARVACFATISCPSEPSVGRSDTRGGRACR